MILFFPGKPFVFEPFRLEMFVTKGYNRGLQKMHRNILRCISDTPQHLDLHIIVYRIMALSAIGKVDKIVIFL